MSGQHVFRRWLDVKQAARHLGRSKSTLDHWRLQDIGPPSHQPGGKGTSVYYDPVELDAWVAAGGTALLAGARR
jgi:hypothetical protein